MVAYLLKTQRGEGHWTGQMCRPPLEESYQTCTVLAVQGIRKHASQAQQADAEAAIAKAKAWLAAASAKSQEDKVARLWGLALFEAPADEITAARAAIMKAQRADGGWAQLDEMESDAYATGQTLFVLQATGLDPTDCSYQRGAQFLLRSQRDDGNWRVETRSKPVQPYFDYDDLDPLGRDQFISTAATGWAVAALAAAADPPDEPREGESASQ
jgi:N-acyl-D-amino-acid deacylase